MSFAFPVKLPLSQTHKFSRCWGVSELLHSAWLLIGVKTWHMHLSEFCWVKLPLHIWRRVIRYMWQTFPSKIAKKQVICLENSFTMKALGLWWTRSWPWAHSVSLQQRRLTVFWTALGALLSRGWRILPIYSVLLWFAAMCPVLGFKIQKRDGSTDVRQQRSGTAMKTFGVLKDLWYKKRLRKQELLSLEKRRFKGFQQYVQTPSKTEWVRGRTTGTQWQE